VFVDVLEEDDPDGADEVEGPFLLL